MKKFAQLLIPLVLLLAAVPSYAACTTCDITCNCVTAPAGNGTRCRLDKDCCHDVLSACFSDGTETAVDLAAQYRIASVEVITVDAAKPAVEVARQQPDVPVETISLVRIQGRK